MFPANSRAGELICAVMLQHSVPACHPLRRQIKQRHHVVARDQHAVELCRRAQHGIDKIFGMPAARKQVVDPWRRPPHCGCLHSAFKRSRLWPAAAESPVETLLRCQAVTAIAPSDIRSRSKSSIVRATLSREPARGINRAWTSAWMPARARLLENVSASRASLIAVRHHEVISKLNGRCVALSRKVVPLELRIPPHAQQFERGLPARIAIAAETCH